MKKTTEELRECVYQLMLAGFNLVKSKANERSFSYLLMANTRAIIPDRVSVVFQHNQTGFCIRLLVKKPRLRDDDLMYRYSVAPSLSEFYNELGRYKLIPLGATMNAAIKHANEVGERFVADNADKLAMKE
jgi:hypothetical protein